MKSKTYIYSVLIGFIAIIACIGVAYLLDPYLFYFRAWEFTENTTYKGVDLSKTKFRESGDSSRQYLIQRYLTDTVVTVDKYGNRKQFVENAGKPSILFVGDSQLWGSGVSDEDNITWILGEKTGAPIYNAGRRHGLWFLKNPLYKFKTIVLTITERDPVSNLCLNISMPDLLEKYPTDASFSLPAPNYFRYTLRTARFVNDVIRAWMEKLYHMPNLGIMAPEDRMDTHGHVKNKENLRQDLECISKLHDFFAKTGVETAFFFFPANQTIYGTREIDDFTKNYIELFTKTLTNRGIKTFNSKSCLLKAKALGSVAQMHDTHINGAGHRALAHCLLESEMRTLF